MGAGVPKNYSESMQWNVKAAAGGNTDAMVNIGFLYQHGQGVPKNLDQARYWYNLAAGKGNDRARRYLSSLPAK